MMFSRTDILSLLAVAGICQAQMITKNTVSPRAGSGPYDDPPMLGFGTWMLDPKGNCSEAVAQAIINGYRHFDTATAYQNQPCVAVGLKDGMKRAGIKRSDLWVTSKLWSTRHGSKIASGMEANLKELGLDYLDMSLMHFPIGTANGKPEYDILATWREMEKLVSTDNRPQAGKSRFIGISNFNVTQLLDLVKVAKIKPKVHQIELHPYLQQTEFVDLHDKLGVGLTAYAPLADTNPAYRAGGIAGGRYMLPNHPVPLLSNPILAEIGKARGCTPAQVSLKWNMKRGIPVHPKAARVAHQKENMDAYKCALTQSDMIKIQSIEATSIFRMWDPCPVQLGLPCYLGLEGGNETDMKRANGTKI